MNELLSVRPHLREFLHNHHVQWIFLACLAVNILAWGGLAWFIRPSEVPILLRYNIYLGFDLNYVVEWKHAYRLPAVALGFLFINAIVAFALYRQQDRFGAYIVLFGSLSVQLAMVISLIAIILVNL